MFRKCKFRCLPVGMQKETGSINVKVCPTFLLILNVINDLNIKTFISLKYQI